MSEHILSISEAQKKLTRLPEQFEKDPEAVRVTRYGKPVMATFHESDKVLQNGETVEWEDAKRELGLA
jgi:PHD/YefM family antitoxin component YafN of YafNO toxin-antitoxin module